LHLCFISTLTCSLPQHPSFPQPVVTLGTPPFRLQGSGWGFFTIRALVVLKRDFFWNTPIAKAAPGGQERGMLPLTWTLNFEQSNTETIGSFEIGRSSAVYVPDEADEEL
jgi:hypothetical protein